MNGSKQEGREPQITPAAGRRWFAGPARMAGILFGVATHVLFAATVYQLFYFLRDGAAPLTGLLRFSEVPPGRPVATAVDVLLTLQYAVIHSLLLYPSTRRRLGRFVKAPFYGCFFCCITCLTLLLTMAGWQAAGPVLYEFRGTAATVVSSGFFLSWVALFYSLAISGLGYQTGWTPWWAWVQGRTLPRRQFTERGAGRLFRHPIYLSFLGLIWFTTRMTLDHAVLTGVWTVYIFAGSWLKDERLAFYVGPAYREYQSRVPGYPFLLWGPLGLRAMDEPDRATAISAENHSSATPRSGNGVLRKAA